MKSWVLVTLMFINGVTLFAQEIEEDTTQISPWRIEFQIMSGTSKVMEIKDFEQPKVGTASQSGSFMIGLEYRLGENWSLYSGIHTNFRQGQAWANGIPFELMESGLDIPILLRVRIWNPLGILPAVGLEAGIGPYYGLVSGLKAYEIPGVVQPLARGADVGFFGYHHLGVIAELRIRLRISELDEVIVSVHGLQDLATFGADDNLPVVPKFNLGGIAIGFSRPVF